MDEQDNSLRIVTLAGHILTRDRAAINVIMRNPEQALGQKFDAIKTFVDSLKPGALLENERQINSVVIANDSIMRHRVLQIAVAFLRRALMVGAPQVTLNTIQNLLNDYETHVKKDILDETVIEGFLNNASALYNELRDNNILPFIKNAEKQAPSRTEKEKPSLEQMVQTPLPPTGEKELQQEIIASPPVIRNEQDFDKLNIRQLSDYINRNNRKLLNYTAAHESVDDVRNFAKAVWRANNAPDYTEQTPMPEQSWQSPQQTPAYTEQTPMPEQSWQSPQQTPAYTEQTPMPEQSWQSPQQTPAYTEQTPMPEQGWQSPQQTPNLQPMQTPNPVYEWEEKLREMFPSDLSLQSQKESSSSNGSTVGGFTRRRRRRAPPLPELSSEEEEDPPKNVNQQMYSSEEDEPDKELARKRRREEDKNYLRLKALELSKYAGVNERMEKIVQVTKAMQQTYDYCNCKNTISGTPSAVTFVQLLRRLNTYNLSHVEMTVNFYELLYPLTLYDDESNRIVSYIFAATNYFQNCAKNFGNMRVDFNKYGPFPQIDSLVMFVIKFNFLCDLQAFFGKIDTLPMLAQPNIKVHTVLVMRDKIVKLAFNELQYDTTLKTDNRRDPKHLQRLIQLMNADFNVI
ncbi:viral capsid associated protein [Spilosoma obliqua nucleopolyhedrosis virus]|uniref:P87 n=1 Tax=Hyphantria cunea nuclear polyhedrosis virus TaxID=28288 RepID=Q2NNY4_NPVHC|nr:P87 [Hyphantria cunea nucleopolyhedrovirus]AUR45076.1 viral capsid associated protein [Spilosoma obliqua nucleopolyhedrosis virus]BAE72338.1 P87 [Hyphantria cunea nucleopolyhedrovirus]